MNSQRLPPRESLVAIALVVSLILTMSHMLIQPVNAMQTHSVIIQDFAFHPQILNIQRGDTVIWSNNDPVIYTLWFVYAEDQTTYERIGSEGLSDPILPGETWSWVFDETVNLQYYSFERLWITGNITVRSPPPAWQEGVFEFFGPRCDRLIFRPYMNPALEYEGLLADEIDFTDWTVTREWMDAHCEDPDIGCAPYYERGMYQFDLNCNFTFPANDYTGDPNVARYCGLVNPTADVWFRRALCYLVDKTRYVVEVQEGLGGEMITVLDPPPPYGPFVEYAGYMYEGPPYYYFDPNEAEAILDAHGWDDSDDDGIRNYPEWMVAGRPNIDDYLGGGIDFVMRTDKPLWLSWSNMFADEMEAIGIPVYRDAKDRLLAIYQVMIFLEFHIYAGGWSFGRDPLYVRDLYYSQWYIGALALNINYQHFNNSEFDYWGDQFYYADSIATAQTGCRHCQRIVLEDVPVIPLVYTTGAKGYRETVCSGLYAGQPWEGFVNEQGYGINSRWTYLNAHPACVDRGGTLRAGLSTDAESLNIIAAYMYYDYCVLDALFESPISYNPYNPSFTGDFPSLAWWEVDTWDATGVMDPDLPGYPDAHLLTFHFSNQTYWHDGTPLTAHDFKFTVDFLNTIGPEYAWNQPSFDMVYDVTCPDDYTAVVRCNCQSIFALHLIGGNPVIPEHIWELLEDSAGRTWMDPEWDASCVMEIDVFADPEYMVGSGPYEWNAEDSVAGEFYVLDAFANYWGWSPVRVCGPNPLAIPSGTGEEQKWNGIEPEVGVPQSCNNNWLRGEIAWETDHPQGELLRIYFAAVNSWYDDDSIDYDVDAWARVDNGPPQPVTIYCIGDYNVEGTTYPASNPNSYERLYGDIPNTATLPCDYPTVHTFDITVILTNFYGVHVVHWNDLEFHVVCPGDCNSDGVVDMADISLLINYFATSYAYTPLHFWFDCDVNKDNFVDMADISIAIANFMRTCVDL